MADIWSILNDYSLGVLVESTPFVYKFPVVSENATFKVISGELPPGMWLDGQYLRGTPGQVPRLTTYKFVIRATVGTDISDRTFSVQVAGPDEPVWVTKDGQIPIGLQQTYYILDESYVDFQLVAIDQDTAAGQELKFWIPSDGGLLPPGLQLTSTGRLHGWIKPLLIITKPKTTGFYGTTLYDSDGYDYGITNVESYDSMTYDSYTYDYATEFTKPVKYNRNYQFTVIVSDGDTSVTRKFSIYVIGDSLTADTTAEYADNFPITVDNAFIREPIWKTPTDLGVYRASNYFTRKLEIYETADRNPVTYFLNVENPDKTISLLPPGVQLDNINAELFGVIPYQPAITKIYTFTITAIRLGHLQKVSSMLTPSDLSLIVTSDSESVIKRSRVIYRNSSLEGSEYGRVYASLYYVPNTTGLIITGFNVGHGIYQWVYKDIDAKVTLYFKVIDDSNSEFPWYDAQWYLDESHTIPSSVYQIIEPMTTSGSVYTDDYETASSSRTFTISIIGEIDSAIRWNTPAMLGSIDAEQISMIELHAASENSKEVLTYEIVNAGIKRSENLWWQLLPPGLTLSSYGNVIGRVTQFANDSTPGLTNFHEVINNIIEFNNIFDDGATTFDREFIVEIAAYNNAKTSYTTRLFTLLVTTPNKKQYCDIICVPFLPPTQRELFQNFITNRDIFEYSAIYRQEDPNFGIRPEMSMLVYAGAELQPLDKFKELITRRKTFNFGDIKVASARSTGSDKFIYEVIYVEMIDPLENNNGHLPTMIRTYDQMDPINIDTDVSHLGELDPTLIYHPDDIVSYNGELYQAIHQTVGSIDLNNFIDPGYFQKFTEIRYRGQFNLSYMYNQGDIVSALDDKLYIAINKYIPRLNLAYFTIANLSNTNSVNYKGQFDINSYYNKDDYVRYDNAIYRATASYYPPDIDLNYFKLYENIEYCGKYDNTAQYNYYDSEIIISYNQQLYKVAKTTRGHIPDAGSEYFQKYLGVNYVGQYDSAIIYHISDIISSENGILYIAIKDTKIDPSITLLSQEYYQPYPFIPYYGEFSADKTYYYGNIIIDSDGSLFKVTKTTKGIKPYTGTYYFKKYQSDNITIDNSTILINDPYSSEKSPSSISLWREQIEAMGDNDRNYLPLWMRTIQEGGMVELDYTPAVVLCYCKVGYSKVIIENIKNSKFKLNDIQFEVDRFVINKVVGYDNSTFVVFRNDRTITT